MSASTKAQDLLLSSSVEDALLEGLPSANSALVELLRKAKEDTNKLLRTFNASKLPNPGDRYILAEACAQISPYLTTRFF